MKLKSGRWRYSDAPLAFLGAARSQRIQPATKQEFEQPDPNGFISAKEAAAFLGIPIRSLFQYVQQGRLPSYKLGRHRLFRRLELLETLRGTTKATRDEILR